MNTLLTLRVMLTVVFVIVVASCDVRSQEIRSVTPERVDSLIRSDSAIVLLDVRTKAEFEGDLGHLKGALLIPVQELESRIGELHTFKSKTIIAYCRSGMRSATATMLLVSKGYHALNMEGGMLRWDAEHLPVVKEQPQKDPAKK